MKKATSLFVTIALIFCLMTLFVQSTYAENTIAEREAALSSSLSSIRGTRDFNGYCGSCTAYQLGQAGLFSKNTTAGSNGWNGNQCYNQYKNTPPINGMTVTSFPGSAKGGDFTISEICNLLNESNTTGTNTYTIFCFNKGSSNEAGQTYGHVLLVHAVYNGKVYWGESFGSACRIDTITNFANTYKQYYQNGKTCYVFDGAISYDYNPIPITTFEFRNVQYPDPFKINTTQGWYLGSGTVVSNANLTSIRSILSNAEASWSQDTGEISISGHSFAIATRSFDQQVKFSDLTTEGNYTWTLIAKDDQNRVLSMTIPFYVSATQSTNSNHTISKTYVKLIEAIDPIFEEGELIHLGEIGTISPRIYPEDATNQSLIWESTNQAVLTIDNMGKYETITAGETNITCYATDGSGVQSQTVHVRVGHSCEWVTIIEPSALHEGLRENKCNICGFVEDSEVIPSFAGKCYNDPDFITPGGLTAIDDEAFSGIGVQYIKLSDKVASIGKNAFASCTHLKQIFIPSSVTFIGENAIPNTGSIDIVGFKNSEAENYAQTHSINFIALDDDLFEWVPIESVPENAQIVNIKTQYSFRERGEGSYTEWSEWGNWLKNRETITDSDLMQEESKPSYAWWAAKCKNCGHNNPRWDINCKNCGNSLNNMWESVFAYTTDLSMVSIDGRSDGKYVDGKPYWRSPDADRTEYRYRTREFTYSWGAWSTWSDMPVTAAETREVNTRTVVQYRMN